MPGFLGQDSFRLPFAKQFTAPAPTTNGGISIEEIKRMDINEFYRFKDRLTSLRENVRYDTRIYNSGTAVTSDQLATFFVAGIGDQDVVVNVPATSYTKQRFHTNMLKGGQFGEGSLTIVYGIEYSFSLSALKGTTYTNASAYGANTNPLGVDIALFDPALMVKDWNNQTELQFWRDEDVIVKNKTKYFPENGGISGFMGSNEGGIAQNSNFGYQELLNNPQVFRNDENFSFPTVHLAPWDLSAMAMQQTAIIQLRTMEFRPNYT